MKPKILIATTNVGKYKEMMEVLADLPINFVSLKDLKITADCQETGDTYKANAYQKAEFYHKLSGDLPTIAEDSGLEVTALKGELGIKTRRWGAGEQASDEEWMKFFLQRLAKESNRSGKFCCCAAFVDQQNKHDFYGEARGTILEKTDCAIPKGIPVAAYFVPTGCDKPFAAMSLSEKNQINHRVKAMRQLRQFLVKWLDSKKDI